MALEKMDEFFENRVEGYDQVLKKEIGGERFYPETAKLIPEGEIRLLDIGCGTGLELEEIFRINPGVRVTGIDLCRKMIDELKLKHRHRLDRIELITGDYFEADLGNSVFDVALSVMTLHHFSHELKTGLYRKIRQSLKPDGFYIETDYMAPDQEYEDFHFEENRKIRAQQGITEGFYHYDTPCTFENQEKMLIAAGFSTVEKVWHEGTTVILLARKL